MITADDPFRSAPRITRDRFARVMYEQAAPTVVAERDPRAYWDVIASYGIDPLLVLAMFNHESTMGRKGVACTTHSWGNTRKPNFGATPIGEVPGASGVFPVWRDWLDGCKSTVARLASPDYVYTGWERVKIREIFEWHDKSETAQDESEVVWAPAGDYNNPSSYLRAVIDFMNEYADGGEVVSVGRVPKPPMLTDIRAVKKGGYSASDGMPRVVEAIVNHISDGNEHGGDITQLTQVVSANYYINKAGVIRELVPPTECAWTNGVWGNPDLTNPLIANWFKNGWNPNTRTISKEHEGQHGQPLTAAQVEASAALDAWLAQEFNLPIDRAHIIGHNQIDSVTRSYCPGFPESQWTEMQARAQALINAATETPPVASPDDRICVAGNPLGEYGFRLGFKGRLQKIAAAISPNDIQAGILAWVGWPEEDEWMGVDGCAYQSCERGILQWTPDTPEPWDIVLLHRHATPPPDKEATNG